MMPDTSKSAVNSASRLDLSKSSQRTDKPTKKSSAVPSRRTVSKMHHEGVNVNIAEILDTEYRGISLYAVAMGLLVIAILWTGISVVEQIQDYHQRYGTLLKLKRDFRQLQIEHQRMLIEQQTFSATPQVTNRAVAELNMYYPNLSDRMILHSNQVKATTPSSDMSNTAIATTDTLASTVQP